MIRALLRAGRTVGVTGPEPQGHHEPAGCRVQGGRRRPSPTPIVGLQAHAGDRLHGLRGSTADQVLWWDVAKAEMKRENDGLPPFNLIAGTAWLWSRDDHARQGGRAPSSTRPGEFSPANALAVGPAAPRLVLLEPPPAAQPAPEGDPPSGHRGLPCSSTWPERMASLGRAGPVPGCDVAHAPGDHLVHVGAVLRESAPVPGGLSGQGLTLFTMAGDMRGLALARGGAPKGEHQGVSRRRPRWWSASTAGSVGWRPNLHRQEGGRPGPWDSTDLLVVAPYNAQVSRISGARWVRRASPTPAWAR